MRRTVRLKLLLGDVLSAAAWVVLWGYHRAQQAADSAARWR